MERCFAIKKRIGLGHRKFFSLLAGAAVFIPFAAMQKSPLTEMPVAVKKQLSLAVTSSSNVGIGVNSLGAYLIRPA